MNSLKALSLLACLVLAMASPSSRSSSKDNSVSQALKPSEWLSVQELQSIPAVDDLTVERLESMSLEDGAELLQKVYHLAQINHDLEPTFVPNNIQVYIPKPNGEKIQSSLEEVADRLKQRNDFGTDEVTIIVTGLPQTSEIVKKTLRKLVKAYMQRYNLQEQQQQALKYGKDYDDNKQRTSSEEDYSELARGAKTNTGDVVIVDLGSTLTNFKRYAMLDIEKTGEKIGRWIVDMVKKLQMPYETIHVIGQNVGAHVAGAAANEFTRLTGNKLRRVTGLDPSKIVAKKRNTLIGLSRGDAVFVDAIHSSVYGMGTFIRCGNADFYPNGLNAGVPGADNVVEASMRATRYFAESVRPGNERNFPAVPAKSLKQYKQNDGFGQRTYMGIDAPYDIQGDYILQVNEKSPFGRNAPAKVQNNYHGVHTAWRNAQQNGRDYE